MIKKLISFAFFLFVLTVSLLYFYVSQKNDLQETINFEVPVGSSVNKIARELESNKIIHSSFLFKLVVKLTNSSKLMKAGDYELPAQKSTLEIISLLKKGQSKQYSFTIIEGSNIRELLAQIKASPTIKSSADSLNDYEVLLREIGASETYPEGLFLAETYFYSKNASALSILKRSYKAQQDFLQKAWAEREKNPYIKTPYQALTLASIIEKETGVSGERRKIAGVFVNRLRLGMRLQTDPTVIYGLGESYDGDIKYKDLRTDTPYNTYTRYGLPPTPIAMTGKASILAALHPEETEALYFVANGEGGHTFSATLEAHEAAVQVYLKKTR